MVRWMPRGGRGAVAPPSDDQYGKVTGRLPFFASQEHHGKVD